MIEIKQLTKDDVFIVNHLAKKIWPIAFKEILSPEQIKYMLDWMYEVNTLEEQVVTGHLFYLITKDGMPKGFMGVEPHYPQVGTLRIHKLYIDPEDHGNGLGKALIEKAKEIADELDIASLNLNVNRFNDAVKFYEHLGFTIVKEENISIGKGYYMEDYVMAMGI